MCLITLSPSSTNNILSPLEGVTPFPHTLLPFSVTGQTCNHVGYEEFNPPSWNSECAPNKSSWFRSGLDPVEDICGLKGVTNPEENWGYPQEFWACSDISITFGGR